MSTLDKRLKPNYRDNKDNWLAVFILNLAEQTIVDRESYRKFSESLERQNILNKKESIK